MKHGLSQTQLPARGLWYDDIKPKRFNFVHETAVSLAVVVADVAGVARDSCCGSRPKVLASVWTVDNRHNPVF